MAAKKNLAMFGVTLAFVGASIAAAPAVAENVNNKNVASSEPENFEISTENGKNIYKAIIFGVGPEADYVKNSLNDPKFDEVVDSGNEYGESEIASIDAMIQVIDDMDPTFFENFSKSMHSGSPLEVENALAEGIDYLNEVSKLSGGNTADPASPLVVVAVWGAAVWDGVVAVNYGAAVNVAYWVNAVGETVGGATAGTDLELRETIASLTDMYAN